LLLLLAAPLSYAQDCVVLLHGLGRTTWSMRQIENTLAKAGYSVVNQSYLSREKSISELSDTVGEGIRQCEKTEPDAIHFVTHSLGGILVRAWFQTHPAGKVQRVVMLGPPNHGSEIVDRFKDSWWFKWMTGPTGQQLGTDAASLPNTLKPIPLEIGIIAGYSSSDPWFGSLFNGANDGKVSVESTKLPEMKDFIQVENGHTFMANSRSVIEQIKAFLSTGYFARPNSGIASTNKKGA
jgi:pimeloyl-ACP methyl ester carboxylesterase